MLAIIITWFTITNFNVKNLKEGVMPEETKTSKRMGRPPKYKTEEERKAAQKAQAERSRAKWKEKRKDVVKNISIGAPLAVQFLEARNKYNATSALPFELTNTQFLALVLERWEKTGRKSEGGGA